jgi:hypothetical protein
VALTSDDLAPVLRTAPFREGLEKVGIKLLM